MSAPSCHDCGRTLVIGETAYASDWTVIDTSGTTATTRLETRYTCEDCEAAA